jgi:C-terminal processing protease CtpA/Prc
MGCKVMILDEKIKMFLMAEAVSVKLTPLAKSSVRLQDVWEKEELDNLIDKMASNNKSEYKYEISLIRKDKNKKVMVYRRGDEQTKRNMNKEGIDMFKKEITGLLNGTGMKVVGDAKSADWVSIVISA